MLSESEINALSKLLNLPSEGVAYLKNARTSPPSRRVGSHKGNVCVAYPSHKMGFTIQAESHTVEFRAILEMEHDDAILEYYDQPPSVRLEYIKNSGEKTCFIHTPDFIVIKPNGVGWVECKPEEKLVEMAEKDPARVFKDSEGVWRCPPGEQRATMLGFSYKILSSAALNETLARNITFLETYLRSYGRPVAKKVTDALKYAVKNNPGVTLSEIFETMPELSKDDFYALIAQRELFVDLRETFLGDDDLARLYLNAETAKAFHIIEKEATPDAVLLAHRVVLQIGQQFEWSGRKFEIVNLSAEKVSVKSDKQLVTLDRTQFATLVQNRSIIGVDVSAISESHSQAMELLVMARPDDFKRALEKYSQIRGNHLSRFSCRSKRTLSRYQRQCSEAERLWGKGFLGLMPRHRDCGNRLPRFETKVLELIEQTIQTHYLTPKSKSRKAAYDQLVLKAHELGIQNCPSYRYFKKAIKQKSKHLCTMARAGKRAAYQHEPRNLLPGQSNNNHGDRPLEIAHIDHTQCDIELVCSDTGKCLGRPWISVMIDAYSRRVLSFHITFDAPSYRSCMMLIRACVKRHGTLPYTLVVDNGKEFHSTYFALLMAMYARIIKWRPPAKGRFGSIIERFFDTLTKDVFNSLAGNTQVMKNVRQVTNTHNPKNHAVWTLERLHTRLEEYMYELYDQRLHTSLDMSPRDKFNDGMKISGDRETDLIPVDYQFRILTMPGTSKGTAKVQPRAGIKINSIYYWHDDMRTPQIELTSVAVRYDPENIGLAYAQLNGRWVECLSAHHEIFSGRTEKQIKIASEKLRRLKSVTARDRAISSKEIAEFLRSSEDEELVLQQRRDQAQKNIHRSSAVAGQSEVPSNDSAFSPTDATLTTMPIQSPAFSNEIYQSDSDQLLTVYTES